MHRIQLVVWIATAALHLTATAQTLTVQVRDSATHEIIVGAEVWAVNISNADEQISAFVDSVGQARLQLNLGHAWLITVERLGYHSHTWRQSPGRPTDTLIYLPRTATFLDELVVTSTRSNQTVAQAVVPVIVMQSSWAERNQSPDLQGVLTQVPGVSVVNGQASIRGGSGYSFGAGSRVAVLYNGLPVLTPDAGSVPWTMIPVEVPASIEITKGAGSLRHGSGALNGSVHVNTRWPGSQPTLRVRAWQGMVNRPFHNLTDSISGIRAVVVGGDTTRMDTAFFEKAWWGNRPPLSSGLDISGAHRRGRLDVVVGLGTLNNQSFRQGDYDQRARLTVQQRWRSHRKLIVMLGNLLELKRDAPFLLWQGAGHLAYLPLPNTIPENRTMRWMLDPAVLWEDSSGLAVEFRNRYFRLRTQNQRAQSISADQVMSSLVVSKGWNLLPDIRLKLEVGGFAQGAAIQAEIYADTLFRSSQQAGFMEVLLNVQDRLRWTGGVRIERHQLHGAVDARPVLRSGLNYRMAEATWLYLSVGQGYRYPTTAERHIRTVVGPLSIFQNSTLEPESGHSMDAGVRQAWKVGSWTAGAELGGFFQKYADMIEFRFGGETGTLFGFQSVNSGATRIKGFEIQTTGSIEAPSGTFRYLAGYLYVDPRFVDFDSVAQQHSSASINILKYRHKQSLKLDAEIEMGVIKWGVQLRYNSPIVAIDGVFEVFIAGVGEVRREQGRDLLCDMRLRVKLSQTAAISAVVTNLTNLEYSRRPALMEAPRSVALRFEYDWKGSGRP